MVMLASMKYMLAKVFMPIATQVNILGWLKYQRHTHTHTPPSNVNETRNNDCLI